MGFGLYVYTNHEPHEIHENYEMNISFFGFCVFSVFRGLVHMKLHLKSFSFDVTGRSFGQLQR